MSYHWPADTVFQPLTLEVEDRTCAHCGQALKVCCHRHRRLFTCASPVQVLCKLCHCPDPTCPGHAVTVSPEAETALAMPHWVLAWDAFCWLGHRRFARHWSVPQIRDELADRFHIALSVDAVERYVARYQTIVAARQRDPAQLTAAYRRAKGLILAIDGLQPEKGHETLYVVREVGQKRVWFAEALLSSSADEVRRLLAEARAWAERLELPVRLWLSDKQDAFVTGIAAEFPGVPHRLCANHFLRDLAKPMLEADSHAKVQMRKKVRGLREVERAVLEGRSATEAPATEALAATEAPTTEALAVEAVAATGAPASSVTSAEAVVLDYCAAVRGILNDDQGGPLHPPGLRMAEALTDVRDSLRRNLGAKKGGASRTCSPG
jgi:hypothetical protein